MPADARSILHDLDAVEHERSQREASPELSQRVAALKAYQQRRFMKTYADLLASPRYAPAARFFLDELYGPGDFSRRDAQFARVVPALVRLFPQEVVDTVGVLGALHALSERLDTTMARQLRSDAVDAAGYVSAWQATGGAEDRERQIGLTLAVGAELDRLTRKPLLRGALHMMRAPARAAGLGELQQFLETGFDTFKAMQGSSDFLATVGARERGMAAMLFAAPARAAETVPALPAMFAELP